MPEATQKLCRADKFRFRCHKEVSCFNQCCRDVNIVLTPYDIVRMKRRLGVGSEEFLLEYAVSPFTKEQKLPVVLIKMNAENEKRCPFVTKEGCSIYEDRPWACRMFPLGLASPKAGMREMPFYFLLEEAKCEGLKEPHEQTVDDWLTEQGINAYDQMGEPFKEVTLHDYLLKGGELNPQKMGMFHTVCYNLDKFRRQLFSNEQFFKLFEITDGERELISRDDEALLLFGFRWLRFSLYGDKVIRVTEEARRRVEEKVEKLKQSERSRKSNLHVDAGIYPIADGAAK